MPIEFRCTGCQRLLRTADDTAGKNVRCPECGAVMTVPQPAPVEPILLVPVSSTQISVGDVLGRTWAIFREQWTVCLVAFLVFVAIYVVIGSTTASMQAMVKRNAHSEISQLVGSSLVELGSTLVSTWIGIGQVIFMLNLARGRQVDFLDILRGGPYLSRAFLASVLTTLMVVMGLVLLIVPGVVLWLMFSQFLFLIVDRNAGVFDSLAMSRELTRGNKMTLLVVFLAAVLVGIAVVIATLGLAVLVVGPCLMLLPSVVYLAMIGELPAPRGLPAGPSSPPSDSSPPG